MKVLLGLMRNFRNKAKATLVSDDRKKEISDLCEGLISKYRSNGKFDFNKTFSDYNVNYIEDEKVMDISALGPIDGQHYIFTHPYGTAKFREYYKMHELGHIILGHNGNTKLDTEYKEHETEFLTRSIVGNYSLLWITIQSTGLVIHLMTDHKENYEEHNKDKESYYFKTIKKYIDLNKIPSLSSIN